MRFKMIICPLFLMMCLALGAQSKMEREFRIKRSQFPKKTAALLKDHLQKVKQVRYYKEVDSVKVSYEVKFKKDRLHYSMEFSEDGHLEDIEVSVEQLDVPNETWDNILGHLERDSVKYRIIKIQQQYPVSNDRAEATTIKNAFQNLMLPYINYEVMVSKKGNNGFRDYEILFDAEGHFIRSRKSLPPNYDHILY